MVYNGDINTATNRRNNMFKVTIKSSSGRFGQHDTAQVLGVFSSKEEAVKAAADSGLECSVSAYKLTPAEAKRAAMLASFGKKYVPAVAK